MMSSVITTSLVWLASLIWQPFAYQAPVKVFSYNLEAGTVVETYYEIPIETQPIYQAPQPRVEYAPQVQWASPAACVT